MPIVTDFPRSDPNNTFEVRVINGRRFPPVFDEELLKNIPHLKLRDDDVMICGFMRSGTHWTFEILNILLSGVVETVPDRKESLHLEQASQEKIDTIASPRVLNSHLLFEELPREVTERKTKIIYLVRDPRDCVASCYTFIQKSYVELCPDWNTTFPCYMELINDGKLPWGSWFENIKSWERALHEHPDHPIHLVYYEELLQDTLKEIMKINDFLGTGRNSDFCKQVVEKTALEKMKVDKEKYTEKFGGQIVHYNKGIVGNWKTMFTVSMNEEFDQLYERKMEGSNFRDRYSRRGRRRQTDLY